MRIGGRGPHPDAPAACPSKPTRRVILTNSTLGLPAVSSSDVTAGANRFVSGVASYDAAGNITTDSKFRSLTYVYDANGRQTSASNGTWTETQVYDSAGQRVQTTANGVTRTMVFDVFGQDVADYSGSTLERENIYRGGQLVATYEAGTSSWKYVMQDEKGSTRAAMNNNGSSSSVIARHDYLPFGEEIASGIGLRTSGQGFAATDTNRQKYAMTERDDVTGLDHTWWRKYESFSGRWTSPDPYNGSASIASPQSFNRYSYTQNDPVNFVDPSGLLRCWGWFEVQNGQIIRFLGISRCEEDTSDPVPVQPWGGGGTSESPGGVGGGGGAPLSPDNQKKFDDARDKVRRRIEKLEKKGKSKCAELLGRAGISLDDLGSAVNSVQAFDGGQSTVSVGEAGVIDLQDPEFQSLSETRQAQTLSAPVSSLFGKRSVYGAVTGSNGSVFFNTRGGIKSSNLFHEAMHVASGLGDVRLAQALKLKAGSGSAAASQVINRALRDYGCL